LLIVTLLACRASTGRSDMGVYVYESGKSKIRITYDLSNSTFSDGHVVGQLRTCPPSYRCLRGGILDFALPANWQELKRWTLEGRTFEVSGTEDLSTSRRKLPVTVIRGDLADATVEYLFSETHGLLGARVKGEAVDDTVLSVSECGFAASRCP
jgi:hypothetical protein